MVPSCGRAVFIADEVIFRKSSLIHVGRHLPN